MQSDLVTRVLLGTIVICLLMLLAQRGLDSAGAPDVNTQPRYQLMVHSMRKGLMLIRMDTLTGVVWRKPFTTEGPWVIVDEETRDAYASASDPSEPEADLSE